jgi:exodeoxyribonuclease V alpha subunit
VRWIEVDAADPARRDALAPLRAAAVGAARRVLAAARAGEAAEALDALAAFRLLCAHRRGPYGALAWNAAVERWLAGELDAPSGEGWYVGRPVLVVANDHSLRLYNGDAGVAVARPDGRLTVAFDRAGGLLEVSPTRLAAVETLQAMTIHKSQGSQLDAVAVILPDAASPILTRELLYTAVTRARRALTLVGGEDAVRRAVEHPVAHASGLAARLWG